MLRDIAPYTARGERGNVIILDEENVQAWIEANAAELLAQGYVRVVVTDHVATRIVGDRRRRRSPPP